MLLWPHSDYLLSHKLKSDKRFFSLPALQMAEAAKKAASHDEGSPLFTLVSMALPLREGKKEPGSGKEGGTHTASTVEYRRLVTLLVTR